MLSELTTWSIAIRLIFHSDIFIRVTIFKHDGLIVESLLAWVLNYLHLLIIIFNFLGVLLELIIVADGDHLRIYMIRDYLA